LSRIPSEFGQLLKRHRQALGLSQRTLAQRAGMDEKSISALESGARRSPKSGSLARLVRALGLTGADARALTGAATRSAADHGPDPAPPPTALDSPVAPQPLVGREEEIAALVERLRGETRLLTLTGPGGIGKTTLAVGVANRLAASFADGVTFVALDPLADATLVPTAIAQAVGLRQEDPAPLPGRLAARLRDQHALLLLDGFEHVLDAATLVADLLGGAPGLTILATSRERLRVRGEEVYPVDPLDPSSAAALFVARARAAGREIAPGSDDAGAVDDICARLDRLPLAIELAGARCRLLPPAILRERLAQCLPLLTGGPRDAPARQQTLRATIDWSHDLLTPDELMLFRRLAVFPAGGTLSSVEAICGSQGMPGSVLDALESLVDKSLVRLATRDHGESRFTMLETIREYAIERLEASGEADSVWERHTRHYLPLVARPRVNDDDEGAWLNHAVEEQFNVQAALGRLLAAGDVDRGLQVVADLAHSWHDRGGFRRGQRWLASFLALPGGDPAVRVRAMIGAATLALDLDDMDAAEALATEAGTLVRAAPDVVLVAGAAHLRGIVAMRRRDFREAVACFADSVEAYRAAGEMRASRAASNSLGSALLQANDYEAARALLQSAYEGSCREGDRSAAATALANLAEVARLEGDFARANTLLVECLEVRVRLGEAVGGAHAIGTLGLVAVRTGTPASAETSLAGAVAFFRLLRDASATARFLGGLASTAHLQGDMARAVRLQREALTLVLDRADPENVAAGIEKLADIAVARHRGLRAARLLGAAAAVREAGHAPLPPADRQLQERTVARARVLIGDAAFEAAREAGRGLTPREAVGHPLIRTKA